MLQIERSANAGDAFKQMTLLIHMNQEVMFKVAIKMSERTLQKAEIPIDELPTGVLQFSLFTSNWVPVAERIVFVNNHTHDFNTKLNPIYVSIEKELKIR